MVLKVEKNKQYLKIEIDNKKSFKIKTIIFWGIYFYGFFSLFKWEFLKMLVTILVTFPGFFSIYFYLIHKDRYELLIIKGRKILFYQLFLYKKISPFVILEVFDLRDLKTIYYKDSLEILIIKHLKRDENPYYKIHFKFKEGKYEKGNYVALGIKLKNKEAQYLINLIKDFILEYKNNLSILEKKNKEVKKRLEITSLTLEERYKENLNLFLNTEKIYFYEDNRKCYLSIDNNILKNSEEINFYVFYVKYLSKKENEDKKVIVGYNGVDGKETTFKELKEDINKIRDSKSVLLTEIK